LLEQQPVLGIAVELRRHERPEAVESLAVEVHGQPAVLLLLDELVGALVPDLDSTGAVLALRDLALESRVVERVILDVDGERPLARLERHALRHGPACEGAVTLETEVVVEPASVVALDDEDRLLAAFLALAEGLRGLFWVPLAPIFLQVLARHGSSATRGAVYATGTRQTSLASGIDRRKHACFLVSRPVSKPGITLWILWIYGVFTISSVPSERKRARRRRRSSSPESPVSSSSDWPSDSFRRSAAASGSVCAPSGGSGTIASTTPSSRQ